ncbi:MAG: DUF948 domain-containing protein, partial [Planctomycetota bacterium]|nr:DUF948 domain-containing protein [Planctomycetota bacterium]
SLSPGCKKFQPGEISLMAWVRLTEESSKDHLGLTKKTLKNYRRDGCPGVVKRGRFLFFDPVMVRRWRGKGEGNTAPSNPTKSDPAPITSIIDPKLQSELREFQESLGDGPLENEIGICKRLFGRLSELVLTWDSKRLLNPEDQSAFCDITKTLAQVTSRIEKMEGRLIEVKKRHGDLLTRSDAMELLRRLADDVTRGSDRLADHLVAAAQDLVPDIDTDALRARSMMAVAKWRDELAKDQKKKRGESP